MSRKNTRPSPAMLQEVARQGKVEEGGEIVCQLTVSQRIALGFAMREVEAARQQIAAVMQDCGLDPQKVYNISQEGIVRLRT